MKTHIVLWFLLLVFVVAPNAVQAHGGRTDASGGHNDNISGGYHLHNEGTRYSRNPPGLWDGGVFHGILTLIGAIFDAVTMAMGGLFLFAFFVCLVGKVVCCLINSITEVLPKLLEFGVLCAVVVLYLSPLIVWLFF